MSIREFLAGSQTRVLIVLGILVVILIIVLILVLSADRDRENDVDDQGEGSSISIQELALDGSDFPMEELIIPDERLEGLKRNLMRSRKTNYNWKQDDIQEYWKDPELIRLKWLEETNRKTVDDLFKEIP
jgi:hypothetical protein